MAIKSVETYKDGIKTIELGPDNITDYGVCGYKNVKKQEELRRKIDWVKKYYPLGLRIRAVISETGGYQSMIEYIPGEYAHRPVHAAGYMFIHCIFVGFKKEYKGRGLASILINECMEETREAGRRGVAVVTRNGSFMAGKDIFVKKGFEMVDRADPDFELMVFNFGKGNENPGFNRMFPEKYKKGLMRSAQCPYSVKNVNAILQTAKKMNIEAQLIELEDAEMAQHSPCAFGTFCIIYDGKIISHHPISNARFENIMRKTI